MLTVWLVENCFDTRENVVIAIGVVCFSSATCRTAACFYHRAMDVFVHQQNCT